MRRLPAVEWRRRRRVWADGRRTFQCHSNNEHATPRDRSSGKLGRGSRSLRELETSNSTPHCIATACQVCSRLPWADESGVQWFVCCIVCRCPLVPLCPLVCPLVSSVSWRRHHLPLDRSRGCEDPRTETMSNSNRPSVRLGRCFRALPLAAPQAEWSHDKRICTQL